MSSFVAKVLEHAGQLEKEAIHEQLDVLSGKLSELELEVHQLAEDKYVNFKPSLETAENLGQKVEELQAEMSSAESKINNEIKSQLSLSTGEFQALNRELSETKIILSGLDRLANIYDLFQTSSQAVEAKRYSEAAAALNRLDALCRHPLHAHDDKITILKAMKTEMSVQRGLLECTLSDAWKDAIKWGVESQKTSKADDDLSDPYEISIRVNSLGTSAQDLVETVEGLHITDLLASRMKIFSGKVKKVLLPFVLENSELSIDLKPASTSQTLKVSLPSKDKLKNHSPKSKGKNPDGLKDALDKSYVSIFSNLVIILEHLHSMFLYIDYGREDSIISNDQLRHGTVSESETDSSTTSRSVAGHGTLMSMLGEEVGAWLIDLIRRTVLAKAVPTCAKDLDGFSDVIRTTKWLQQKLLALGFIQQDNRSLLEHVENINLLYANKKCQMVLEEARGLMTSSLHDTVVVADDKPSGDWPPLVPGGVKKERAPELLADHMISDNTFRMPKCRISQSIQRLVDLAYETLHEATENSSEVAVQIFYSVRNMFEAFCYIVPTYHGQNLETFPQAAALHHNNCFFIGHHLMTLGHQFAPMLPASLAPTFVDLIEIIRRSGTEIFIAQIASQKDLVLESLDGAEGFANVEVEENHNKAEKAIRQVLLQLGLLQKNWKPVLPINIYKKAMGKLIDAVVERTTDCISCLEDIAQDAAKILIGLLTPIEEECGQLLTSPGEVAAVELMRHVPGWSKLTEVKILLDASLADITDRWAEGKGPLALAFSQAKVKQMIRALFQNTDRRAQVLATIK